MNDATVSPRMRLAPGDPFPWVRQRTASLPRFAVDALAGRYIVLCFFGSAGDPRGRGAIEAMQRHRALFDDQRACFFGISVDPEDEAQGRVCDIVPGVRFLWDFDASVSRQCGAVPDGTPDPGRPTPYDQVWIVVDPTLHVLATVRFGDAPSDHDAVFALVRTLPPPERFAGFEIPAPVLVLPNVFDAKLCRHLVGLYDADGGSESGVHRAGAGVHDHAFKRRKDFTIEDNGLVRHLQGLIARRVAPEIARLFFMQITRMERYIVGCYSAEDGGHFRPHRDNGPGLTAHRRFAVSINLTEDFDGGAVSFPEYSPRGLKAPAGWCVVFPCAILHMVSRVTRGRRYAFLPFVYDETGARIRQSELARHKAETEQAQEPASL